MNRRVTCMLVIALLLALPAAAYARGPVADVPAAPTPTPGSAPAPSVLTENVPVEIALTGGVALDLEYHGLRGQFITLSARSLTPALGLDPTIELLGPDGVRLGFNDDFSGTRAGFNPLDSVIPEIKLLADGIYTVRVNTFSSEISGPVEVLVSTGDAVIVPTPAGTYPILTTLQREIPSGSSDCSTVELLAGEVVTVSAHALDPALDTALALLAPDGSTLAFNDDQAAGNPDLGRFDSVIEAVAVPADGEYSLCASGFGGTNGPYELTIQRDSAAAAPTPTPAAGTGSSTLGRIEDEIVLSEVIEPEGQFEVTFEAEGGDVYTFTARALDDGLDPQMGVFQGDSADMLAGSDDHSTSAPDLAYTDARITNLIMPATDVYAVLVGGYQDSAGPFELTITRTGSDAPLGPPEVETLAGDVPDNGVFTREVTLPEGAYVTVTAVADADTLDPQLTLISPDGVIVADNDDHSSEAPELDPRDSRIRNYFTDEGGAYTIEVRGYQGSGGPFTLTISTLQ